ncbi:MAG: IclR family transcriptional regulator C-terminal domain-containing protein, partial [Eubacteriales bacterium]
SDQEHQKQLFCIAAPVFDHRGQVASAISISGLYKDAETCKDERDDLRKMAEEISRDIGFTGIY